MKRPHRSARARRALAAPALALVLAACQGDGPKVDPEVTREIHVRAALDHYDIGDLDRAVDQATRALEIDPDDLNMKLLIGWCFLRKDRTADLLEAERIFVGLEQRHPDDARARLGVAKTSERLAMVHGSTADDVEAGLHLPVGRDPKKEIERLRGEEARLYARAEERYQWLLEQQRDNLEALNGLVRVTSLTGRPEESLTHVGQLVKALEGQQAFYSAQLKNNAFERTIEDDYKRLLRNATTLLVQAHQLAAELHFGLERPSLALGHLDAAIALDPNASPELYAQRAQVLLALSRPESAIEDLDRFIAASTLPLDHPEVQRAWQLRREARATLAAPERP